MAAKARRPLKSLALGDEVALTSMTDEAALAVLKNPIYLGPRTISIVHQFDAAGGQLDLAHKFATDERLEQRPESVRFAGQPNRVEAAKVCAYTGIDKQDLGRPHQPFGHVTRPSWYET